MYSMVIVAQTNKKSPRSEILNSCVYHAFRTIDCQTFV